jgi:hypothetical protein
MFLHGFCSETAASKQPDIRRLTTKLHDNDREDSGGGHSTIPEERSAVF